MGSPLAFFAAYLKSAQNASVNTGVLTSVILAQWADETGYGDTLSASSASGFNLAGVSYNGLTYFADVGSALQAYIAVLNQHDYDGVRAAKGSQAQAVALGRSPWAASRYDRADYDAVGQYVGPSWSAPNPGVDLLSIISQFNLTQYDGGSTTVAGVVSPPTGTPDFVPALPPFAPGDGPAHIDTLTIRGLSLLDMPWPGSPLGQMAPLADFFVTEMSEVDLSSSEVSQVVVNFADPSFELLKSQIVKPQRTLQEAPAVASWLGVDWIIAAVETTDNPEGSRTRVTLRSKVAQLLKQRVGNKTWNNLSPTDWLDGEVTAVGGTLVGQGSAIWPSIIRQDFTMGGQVLIDYATGQYLSPESSWDVAQRVATQLGYVAFEVAGTFYFGKPSWLAKTLGSVTVNWPPRPGSDPRLAPVRPPMYRKSVDDLSGNAILQGIDSGVLTLYMDRAAGEKMTPGLGLYFNGVSDEASGLYLITNTHWYIDGGTTYVYVTGEKPVDPIPTFPLDASGGPAAGTPNPALGQPAMAQGPGASAMDFVTIALSQVGKTYVYGATDLPSDADPKSFDCSSLVQWAAGRLGITLPRTSGEQWQACQSSAVSVDRAVSIRGALLFVDSPDGAPGGQHVAISLGDGQRVVEALNAQYGVGVFPDGFDPRNPWSRAALIPAMNYGKGNGVAP